MRYANLHQLLWRSSSTRQYFLSLPLATQLALPQHNEYIHTAAQLRRHRQAAGDYQHLEALGRL